MNRIAACWSSEVIPLMGPIGTSGFSCSFVGEHSQYLTATSLTPHMLLFRVMAEREDREVRAFSRVSSVPDGGGDALRRESSRVLRGRAL